MPIRKKMETLSNKEFRRLHNTKEEIKWEDKTRILDKFMAELKASGYNESDRYEVLRSGITRYDRLRQLEREGKRPFYREKNYQKKERKEEKRKKKKNWFKTKGNKFTSVFFVPPTPGSKLLKMLRETEQIHQIDQNSRIKFVETSGVKYSDYFKSANKKVINCGTEEKCLACAYGRNRIDCKTTNICYSIYCATCKERGIDRQYIGESARNSYRRQRDHQLLLK